ncbi:MarR family winged helix-turn-helix transcriptional regulator [Tamlana crocina]|uniref:MarR family transcriptional regulator n=1 Tax=Tamlana crocina TaxID=393006 RepID=A0ABX1DDJ6_9FLAO|nr:MarR family transcriptional regulator [Tamlana crocina]NJX16427.1 MarR family transcriptional regulator [Tamlana crocina]
MNIEQILKINSDLPLHKKVVINLLFTYGLIIGKLNEALKPHDISIQQFNVLRILRGQKGRPVTLAAIQERMVNKMSNTTRLVDKLVKKQYVTKSKNELNKRKIDIIITQQGLDFLNKIDDFVETIEKESTSSLDTNEQLELIRLLGKLR